MNNPGCNPGHKRELSAKTLEGFKILKMSTYTQILYQIVFSTKNREKVLLESGHEKLFKFIWGLLKNKKCHLYRIGAVEGHIHIIRKNIIKQSVLRKNT